MNEQFIDPNCLQNVLKRYQVIMNESKIQQDSEKFMLKVFSYSTALLLFFEQFYNWFFLKLIVIS